MRELPDFEETGRRLHSALELVRQDRWVLGGLRDGKMRVVAESDKWPGARPRRRELSPLARRCLYERKPLTLSSLSEGEFAVDDDHWEQDWPAVLYAPVGRAQTRPVGLLIVASRQPHWYDEDEIDYVGTIASTLGALVSTTVGPLGRLLSNEQQAARLLGEGMSIAEIARAMKIDRGEAQELVGTVLQKLSLKSRNQINEVLPDRIPSSNGFLL